MPYKIYKSDGGRYCVHKKKGDGSKGKQIACHATMTKAKAQLSALYANEGKDKQMANAKDASVKVELDVSDELTDELDELKETVDKLEDKNYTSPEYGGYVPWGVYSFAELEKAQDARAVALRVKTLSDQFVEIVNNIMGSEDVTDKVAAVSTLSSEYSTLINKKDDKEVDEPHWLEGVKSIVKETMESLFTPKKKESNGFMLWKEGDQLRWLARYSNNFRDDDSPPEIISADSHQRFVDMVDNKEAPMPELWLWHVPEWKLGQADWLAYDDSGFAIASGTIDRGKEIHAEQIAKQSLVGVSHGMPVSSIARNTDDPTVIVEHITTEISPLPHRVAANKRAEWVLMGEELKEGINMPIPDEKKQALVDEWKMDPTLLTQLESMNEVDAEKATEEGVESKEETVEKTPAKEKEEVVEETEVTEVEETEETTDEETTETPDTKPDTDPPTREEIADAIATVLKPYVELVDTIDGRLKELEKSDEEKVKSAATLTPSASVSALLAQQFSAIGDEATKVDKRKKLAKSGPEEAADNAGDGPMPIGVLNQIVSDQEVTLE